MLCINMRDLPILLIPATRLCLLKAIIPMQKMGAGQAYRMVVGGMRQQILLSHHRSHPVRQNVHTCLNTAPGRPDTIVQIYLAWWLCANSSVCRYKNMCQASKCAPTSICSALVCLGRPWMLNVGLPTTDESSSPLNMSTVFCMAIGRQREWKIH